MDHDSPSLELVVLHSTKPDNVAGENEDSTMTNEPHRLCDGQPETMEQQPNDRHNSQAELVSVPKRLHLGYFSTVWVKRFINYAISFKRSSPWQTSSLMHRLAIFV